jgi:hypothetical protein
VVLLSLAVGLLVTLPVESNRDGPEIPLPSLLTG